MRLTTSWPRVKHLQQQNLWDHAASHLRPHTRWPAGAPAPTRAALHQTTTRAACPRCHQTPPACRVAPASPSSPSCRAHARAHTAAHVNISLTGIMTTRRSYTTSPCPSMPLPPPHPLHPYVRVGRLSEECQCTASPYSIAGLPEQQHAFRVHPKSGAAAGRPAASWNRLHGARCSAASSCLLLLLAHVALHPLALLLPAGGAGSRPVP